MPSRPCFCRRVGWLGGGALFLFMLLSGPAAFGVRNEPQGFGPVRFGDSVAVVKRAFPDISHKGTEEFLALYESHAQAVLGLKPCTVELRLVEDRLYEVHFDCQPREGVLAALQRQFGEPTKESETAVVWLGETSSIVLNPRSGQFAFSDRKLSGVAQKLLLRYTLTHQEDVQPPATIGPTSR